MKTKTLSVKQQAILDAIVQYKTKHDGNSPTLRELVEIVGMSQTAVYYNVRILADRGRIVLQGEKARCIEIPGGCWVPPDGRRESAKRHYRKRRGGPIPRCDCGAPASFTLHSAVGPINLCRNCTKLELESER